MSYRHRITLQHLSQAPNSLGSPSNTWTAGETVYANVRALSGRELATAQSVQAETTHEITMRYRDITSANTKVVFEGVVYDLLSVVPDIRKTKLICTAVSKGETV